MPCFRCSEKINEIFERKPGWRFTASSQLGALTFHKKSEVRCEALFSKSGLRNTWATEKPARVRALPRYRPRQTSFTHFLSNYHLCVHFCVWFHVSASTNCACHEYRPEDVLRLMLYKFLKKQIISLFPSRSITLMHDGPLCKNPSKWIKVANNCSEYTLHHPQCIEIAPNHKEWQRIATNNKE